MKIIIIINEKINY